MDKLSVLTEKYVEPCWRRTRHSINRAIVNIFIFCVLLFSAKWSSAQVFLAQAPTTGGGGCYFGECQGQPPSQSRPQPEQQTQPQQPPQAQGSLEQVNAALANLVGNWVSIGKKFVSGDTVGSNVHVNDMNMDFNRYVYSLASNHSIRVSVYVDPDSKKVRRITLYDDSSDDIANRSLKSLYKKFANRLGTSPSFLAKRNNYCVAAGQKVVCDNWDLGWAISDYYETSEDKLGNNFSYEYRYWIYSQEPTGTYHRGEEPSRMGNPYEEIIITAD